LDPAADFPFTEAVEHGGTVAGTAELLIAMSDPNRVILSPRGRRGCADS